MPKPKKTEPSQAVPRDADDAAPEEGDETDPTVDVDDDLDQEEEQDEPSEPKLFVMPEVVAKFPEHELLSTDTQCLPCKLTESERLAKGHRLAQLAGELDGHRADAKQIKADLKEKEERISTEIGDVARDLRRGAEDRIISTCVLADYRTNEAKTVRQDTCEVLWSRSLTPDERQRVLFPSPNSVASEPGK